MATKTKKKPAAKPASTAADALYAKAHRRWKKMQIRDPEVRDRILALWAIMGDPEVDNYIRTFFANQEEGILSIPYLEAAVELKALGTIRQALDLINELAIAQPKTAEQAAK